MWIPTISNKRPRGTNGPGLSFRSHLLPLSSPLQLQPQNGGFYTVQSRVTANRDPSAVKSKQNLHLPFVCPQTLCLTFLLGSSHLARHKHSPPCIFMRSVYICMQWPQADSFDYDHGGKTKGPGERRLGPDGNQLSLSSDLLKQIASDFSNFTHCFFCSGAEFRQMRETGERRGRPLNSKVG